MAWNTSTHPAVRQAYLFVASPTVVSAALNEYGSYINEHRHGTLYADRELEKLLLARNELSINIALAQVATSGEVIRNLWELSSSSTGFSDCYRKGLRLAILSGNAPYYAFGKSGLFGSASESENAELLKVLREDDEGSAALMANVHSGGYLRKLFNSEPPFNELEQDRQAQLVYWSAHNRRINLDESTEDGPDLLAWDIHKGILRMLGSAPLNESWFRALDGLLDNIDPHCARLPDNDIREILDRWGTVKVKPLYGKDEDEDEQGYATPLNAIDEFRCKVASVYGKRFVDKRIVYLGSIDDEDLLMRCAFYGNHSLTTDEMQAAYSKDKEIFAFAALYNEDVYWVPKKRAALEEMLSGNQHHIYARRCKQIAARKPNFDAKPVSEWALVNDDDTSQPPAEEMKAIASINERLERMDGQIKSLLSLLPWGFIILGGLMLWLR